MANNNDGRLEFKATLDDADVVKKIEGLKKDFKDIGNTTEKVTKQQTTAFNTLGKSVSSLGNIIKSVFAGFGILAGFQAIFSLIRTGVRDIIQFDKAMVNMSAIAGKTRAELRGVESEIRKVASESLNSATAVADMATELIKLGTTPEGVKALLKPVNDLSIASQMSADATAVLLKGTLNAFQASEKEATRYADVMANALNKTALDAQKFADSFTYIASTANVAGYSIEETSAMIGVLVDSNVQASSAGRVLSSVFGRLAKGGKELEGELEKIRNSQDKLAQASKVFGAEGARLGVILANNKDRLAELTKEFENSSGSLAELTNKQLESFSAKLNILTSAWQEFVLSLENGQGVLAKVLRGALDIITDLIGGMSVLAKSQSELRDIRGSSLGSQEIQYINDATDAYIKQRQKRFDANNEIYTAEKKAFEEKEMREKLFEERQTKHGQNLIKLRQEEAQINAKQARNKYDFDRLKQIQSDIEISEASYNAISQAKNEILAPAEITVEDAKKESVAIELTKERLNLLKQINNVERELNDDVLSGRELALLKVERKYEDLIAKAKELGMTDAKLRELQAKETAIVSYKADTDALKTNLEQQKVLYDEFEQYKLKVGVEGAKEMYKNLLDTSKSYYDLVGEELDKVNTTDMTAKERDRYAVLSKMLIEYSDNQNKIERERMQALVDETLSYEQQITDLRTEYAKKRAEITNNLEGEAMTSSLNELEKQYAKKSSELINDFASEKGFGTVLTEGVIGATKQVILAQIESLRNYLKGASNLTKEQVNQIENQIKGLNSKLFQATDDGSSSKLSIFNNQINALRDKLRELEEAKSFYESLELPESSVKLAEIEANIAGVNAQLDRMGGQKAKAIAEEFSVLSSVFSDISNSFADMNSDLSGVFKNLSKISNIASSVSSLFSQMKDLQESQSNGTASFSQYASGVGGIFSAVMGVTSMITSVFDKSSKLALERKREERRIVFDIMKLEQDTIQRRIDAYDREVQSISNRNAKLKEEIVFLENISNQINKMFSKDTLSKFFSGLVYIKDANAFSGLFVPAQEELKKRMDALKESLKGVSKESSEYLRIQKEIELIDRNLVLGKSWQEVEQMLARGGLTDTAKEWMVQYINLGKQLEDAGYKIEDLQLAMRELVTGTTADALSDALADAFKKGEDAVYSFGQTMEEVLKNAVVSAFKNEYIVKEMDELFKMFGDMGLDGQYTQEELDQIRRMSQEATERLQKQWDALNSGLDLNFGTGISNTAVDSVKRITESQADRLVGLMNGLQIATNIQTDELRRLTITAVAFNEYGKQSLAYLNAIQTNTLRTANNTDALGEINSNIRNLANNQVEQNRAYGIQ